MKPHRAQNSVINKLAGIFGFALVRDIDALASQKGYHVVPDIYGYSSHKQLDIRENTLFSRCADAAREDNRTMLYYDRLFFLYQALENRRHQVAADEKVHIAEAGVFRGGGSYFIASLAQEWFGKDRIQLFCVDTFEGHDERDITNGMAGGGDAKHRAGSKFRKTSYESVRDYLSGFPFVLVLKSRIQDCAEDTMAGLQFDFVHLDMDIHQPTRFALDFFGARMKPGAVILVDDYGFTSCPGAKRAVDEYLEANPGYFVKFELMTGQCLLVNASSPDRYLVKPPQR
jgi:O-methyltransferase